MNKARELFSKFLGYPLLSSILIGAVYFIIRKLLIMPFQGVLESELTGEIVIFCVAVLPAVGIALLVKHTIQNGYVLGLTGRKFGKCVLFGWFFLLTSLPILIVGVTVPQYSSKITVMGTLIAFIGAATNGFAEEFLYRSFIANNMMRVWGSGKYGIFAAILCSGLLFGASHGVNGLFVGFTPSVLLQMLYTCGMGFVFGAMYLRTRNLWGCIFIHTLIDFYSFFLSSGTASQESLIQLLTAPVDPVSLISKVAMTSICILIALFLVRKSKQAEIRANWNLAETNA